MDYLELRSFAHEMIDEYGQDGQILKSTSIGDRWDPTNTPGDPINVRLAVIEYNDRDIDGSQIQSGDKQLLISANITGEITDDDIAVVGGKHHEIVRVSPISPGGTVVIYLAQVRRLQ